MFSNSLLEGGQRFILHVVTAAAAAAAAEPVGVGGRAPDGSVHCGLVVLRLRDHLRRRLRWRAVALLPKLPAFLLFLVGAAASHGDGDL